MAAEYEDALVLIWESLSQVCPADFKLPDGESEKRVEKAYYAAKNALYKAGRLETVDHEMRLRNRVDEVDDAR